MKRKGFFIQNGLIAVIGIVAMMMMVVIPLSLMEKEQNFPRNVVPAVLPVEVQEITSLGAGTDEEGDDYYLVTYKTSEGEEKEMRFILLVGMTSFGGDKYEFFFEAEKIATTTAPATQPEEK